MGVIAFIFFSGIIYAAGQAAGRKEQKIKDRKLMVDYGIAEYREISEGYTEWVLKDNE